MTRFFHPTPEWLAWFAARVGDRPVIECGVGDGHTMAELHKLKVRVVGCDPRYASLDYQEWPEAVRSHLLPWPAEEVSLIRMHPMTVLFCRPCHNGFVARTVETMHSDGEAIYVSKPENVGVDFSPAEFRVTELDAPRLREEKTYLVVKI